MDETLQKQVDRRLYNYESTLRTLEKLLKHDPKVRDGDRKLIEAFVRHVRAQGANAGRLAKLVNILRRRAQLMPVPFEKAERTDVEELMTRLSDFEWVQRRSDGKVLRRTRYSPATLADFRHIFKRFMKFVRYGNTDFSTPYPEEVKRISSAIKLSDRREPDYFTDAEAEAMIKAATSLKGKAVISLWAELGGRPAEILLLRVGDIQFDDAGALVHITRGKTGSRTLRAISRVKHLGLHGDAPVQAGPRSTSLAVGSRQPRQRALVLAGFDEHDQGDCKAGGYQKRIHGYMFRHGSTTRNAKYFTDSELKRMYGWSMASRSPAVYIHLSAADVDARYQQVYGSGKTVEPPKPSFAPVICPRCDYSDVAKILYGAPSPEAWKHMAEAKAVWGGCIICGSSPVWYCLDCHKEWGRIRNEETSYCELCGRESSQMWCDDCNAKMWEDAGKILEAASQEVEQQHNLKTMAEALLALIVARASLNPSGPAA